MTQVQVSMIGTGYVGLTNAVALAYLGHHVTCVDVDAKVPCCTPTRPPARRLNPASDACKSVIISERSDLCMSEYSAEVCRCSGTACRASAGAMN